MRVHRCRCLDALADPARRIEHALWRLSFCAKVRHVPTPQGSHTHSPSLVHRSVESSSSDRAPHVAAPAAPSSAAVTSDSAACVYSLLLHTPVDDTFTLTDAIVLVRSAVALRRCAPLGLCTGASNTPWHRQHCTLLGVITHSASHLCSQRPRRETHVRFTRDAHSDTQRFVLLLLLELVSSSNALRLHARSVGRAHSFARVCHSLKRSLTRVDADPEQLNAMNGVESAQTQFSDFTSGWKLCQELRTLLAYVQ